MAPVHLPCAMGTECSFTTMELEYEKANKQLVTHMQFAHRGGRTTHGDRQIDPILECPMEGCNFSTWSTSILDMHMRRYEDVLVGDIPQSCPMEGCDRTTWGKKLMDLHNYFTHTLMQFAHGAHGERQMCPILECPMKGCNFITWSTSILEAL